MSAFLATGNPVFDYRAGFRDWAARLQKGLWLSGLLLFCASGVAWAITGNTAFGLAAAGGVLLAVSGLFWGFYWRRKLRAEFRAEFGNK